MKKKLHKRELSKQLLNQSCDYHYEITSEDILLTELVLYSCHNGERVLLELSEGTAAVIVPIEDVNLLNAVEG